MLSYEKILAIKVDHFESSIIDEANFVESERLNAFNEKYKKKDNVICIVVHM